MSHAKKFILKLEVNEEDVVASQFLAQASQLSRQKIKDAMSKGAVQLQPKRGKGKRLRRASTRLHCGDRLRFHYDAEILARQPLSAVLVQDRAVYSLWDKPPGMMTQGNEYADHCSLLRAVECHFNPPRPVFPIHRLDREASGLVLVAHRAGVAAMLSTQFQSRKVYKRYRVEVLGDLRSTETRIESSLDGKPALTRFSCIDYHEKEGKSLLDVEIDTGRTHQIRRHMASIGHPVIGDPRYGSGNKNRSGMQLRAVELGFHCPVEKRSVRVQLATEFPKISQGNVD